MQSTAMASRMAKEIRMLQTEPPPGVWAAPKGGKVTELEAQIQVRAGMIEHAATLLRRVQQRRAAATVGAACRPPCQAATGGTAQPPPVPHPPASALRAACRAPRTLSTREACSAWRSTSLPGAAGAQGSSFCLPLPAASQPQALPRCLRSLS
jgi:hypothetical protein